MSFKYTNIKIAVFIFLIIIFFSTAALSAEDFKVVFNHPDPVGDDYGPGFYEYPQNHVFQNSGHLFDINALTIFESESEYKFRFSFSELTDPWGAKHSFSLPLIEVYLDNKRAGSNELFHPGANISFKDDFNWNKFLKISGWWVRLYTPESSREEILDINDLSLENNNTAEKIKIRKENNDIYLTTAKKDIGSLDNSKIILLVGSFDPFGYDHFRSLSERRRSWQIYAGTEIELSLATRVLDILVPGGKNQKEILSGSIPEIPYLQVKEPLIEREKTIIDYLKLLNNFSITVLLLYILLILFIIFKFKASKEANKD